ncbi:hypothetical protein Tco_0487171 [Tanacetum coccineum]
MQNKRQKARRNKPMTQAEQRTYMATYLKNQGTWKPTQLKKLTFAELKEEFEKLSEKSRKKASTESSKKQKDYWNLMRMLSSQNQLAQASELKPTLDAQVQGHGPPDIFHTGSWRYYDTCRVHCLNLESTDIYMLKERRYPLPADVCQAMLSKKLQMLKMKLLDGTTDEVCYQLLKMIEKQAGLR